MTAATPDEMHRLLSNLCDGAATPDDHRRLEELLRADPGCRQFYLRYLDLHAGLLTHPDPAAAIERPAAPPRHRAPWAALGAAALAAAVAAVAVWLGSRSAPPGNPMIQPVEPTGYVATLTHGGGCRWDAAAGPHPGDRLAAGAYALAAGVAEVRMDGGAVLTIEAPARFKLDGRREVTVESGRILFQSDGTAETVRVRTPHSEYLNLGTRYVMAVRPGGDDLHVLDGQVRRSAPGEADAAAEITAAGSGRRYMSAQTPGEEIPFDRSMPRPAADDPADGGGLLAYDGFDDPAATGPDRAGGFGWKAGWIPHQGLPPIEVNPIGNLPWPGDADRRGGAVHFRGGQSAMHRYLTTPVRLGGGGSYYLSFRFRRAAAEPGDVNQVMVVLRKWGMTVEQEIMRKTIMKFAVAQPDAVATVQFEGATTRTPMPLTADTTYLAVGKILAGGDGPAQVFFRAYRAEHPPPAREPAEWSVVSPALRSAVEFDQVSVEFTSRAEVWLDELRLGRSWSAVTRAGAAVAPAPGE